MKKRILICLERLDIGGVETAVITQAREYKRRGYEVTLIAKSGCYSEILKKEGFKLYEYDFTLTNELILSKEIENIIEENKITEIHIHQYPCLLHILPWAMIKKIAYIIYIHSSVPTTYEWFEKTYPIFNFIFPIAFKNAEKIVTIRKEEEKINKERFDIRDRNKYYYLKNSLDLEEMNKYQSNKRNKNKILIIGRICAEKEKMIISGINFALKYKERNKNIKITVVGDGQKLEELKEKYPENVEFYGKTTDVFNIMKDYGIIIAADRCVLEALALNRITILSSYEGNLDLVKKNNIEELSHDNFSGHKMKNNENLLDVIHSLTKKQIEEIINENQKYINKNHNIKINILDENLKYNLKEEIEPLFSGLEYFTKKLIEEQQISKKLWEENQSLYQEINQLNAKLNKSFLQRIKNYRKKDEVK